MLRKLGLFRNRRPQQAHQQLPPAGFCDNSEDQEEDGFLLVGESAIERSTVRPGHVSSGFSTYSDAPPSYHSQVLNDIPCPAYHHLKFTNMGQGSSNQTVTTKISPEYVGSEPITKDVVQQHKPNALPPDPNEQAFFHSGSNTNLTRTPRTPRTPGGSYNDAASVVSTLPGEILSEAEVKASARTSDFDMPELYSSPIDGVPFKLAPWLEVKDWDWSSLDYLTIPNVRLEDYQYDFSVERSTLGAYQNRDP